MVYRLGRQLVARLALRSGQHGRYRTVAVTARRQCGQRVADAGRELPAVRRRAGRFAGSHLGSHVVGGTQDHAGRGERHVAARPRDPEVDQVRVATVVDDDVGRLDVPVQDALAVCGVQRAGQRAPQPRGRRVLQPPVLVDHGAQRPPRHVLHDDRELAVGIGEDVVDPYAVGVVHGGEGPRLPADPPFGLLVRRLRGLDRHGAVEVDVARLEDGTHASALELAVEAVAARTATAAGSVVSTARQGR